jgi:integrase
VVYLSMLNSFWRFALKQSAPEMLSIGVIQKWLCDIMARHGALQRVFEYARVLDRFLDWMVSTGSLLSNPLAQIRKQYGQRAVRPIVRALLSPNPTDALEALRPFPRFGSFLGPAMHDHVILMKSMGYRYQTEEANLLRFDRFLQSRPDLSGQPMKVLVREWTKASSAPSHALLCQQVGRTVSKALNRLNPTLEVIHCDRRVRRQAVQLRRRPYIYTEDEVRSLLEVARNFPSPRSPLRPLTLYNMVVLAYCVGLWIGEIVRLNVGDIDFRDGTINVRDTKFFKARRLPLASSVISALRHYLAAREQAGGPTEPPSGLFWHTNSPGRYSRVAARMLLVRILQRAGLKPEKGYAGPRVHDLRHAFVANRMLAWYREGINPQPRLPYLATYLGHKDINSTLVYLTVTQELLQQASERFRVLGAPILRASAGGRA